MIVCDLFHAHEPDHETEILGFPSREVAIEYARRRVRASLEEVRRTGQTRDEVRSLWRTFGEDCRVIGPEGPAYLASSELEMFIDQPGTPEELDWLGLQGIIKERLEESDV